MTPLPLHHIWEGPPLGEPVVLSGSLGSNLRMWDPQVEFFASQYKVIRYDLRGFGKSTPMPVDYPWSIDGIIDDFVRLADELGVERFHMAGAKIGGGIALRFAATRAPRVRTLTVMGARVRGEDARRRRRDRRFRRPGVVHRAPHRHRVREGRRLRAVEAAGRRVDAGGAGARRAVRLRARRRGARRAQG